MSSYFESNDLSSGQMCKVDHGQFYSIEIAWGSSTN